MIKVRATQRGYDGTQIREEGDVFFFHGTEKQMGSWMEKVKQSEKETSSKKDKKDKKDAKTGDTDTGGIDQ